MRLFALDKMVLEQYNYIFGIGTFFAMLDAFNNGASAYPRDPNPRLTMQTTSRTRGRPACPRGPSRTARP
jgi:hypothetical protein